MVRIKVVILFIILIATGFAATQETAEVILMRTEEVYKNLKTYHFRGTISYDWTGEDNHKQSYLVDFQSFKGTGGKLRHQRGMGMSKVVASTDGNGSILFLADKRQYQRSDTADLEECIRKGLKLENPAWVFPILSLLDKYSNLKARFHNPKVISTQTLGVRGIPLNCYVLEGIMEPTDIDAVRGNRKTELWIDVDRHIVLREIHTGTSTDHPQKGENLTETVAFNIAELNVLPAETAFNFQPPQRNEEVNEFFISSDSLSDRAHPFYYELPFLKMKHFKLPTADGKEFAMNDFRGKYVLLDFWATWCAPCHKQMKDLKKILREYEGKSLVVLGLNNEELDITRDFIERHKPAYPMLMDLGGELMSLYGVSNLPVLVLLDRSGNILSKREERQTFKQIDQLLKEAGL